MSEPTAYGGFAHRLGVGVGVIGSEGSGGGDDFGEAGLRRIGLHGKTQRDVESVFSHVPPMLLREALTFGLGQALVAGPLARCP